jgi:hypothetical protein
LEKDGEIAKIGSTDSFIVWGIVYLFAIPIVAGYYISGLIAVYFIPSAIAIIWGCYMWGISVLGAALLITLPYILTGWWLEQYNRMSRVVRVAIDEAFVLVFFFIMYRGFWQ